MKIIDLSHPLYDGMDVYPGDPEVRIKQVHNLDKEGWRLRYLQMSTHIGSHVDAFSHMDKDGETIDNIPIERFIGETKVVGVNDKFPTNKGLVFRKGSLGEDLYDKIADANPKFVVVGDQAELSVELERRLLKKGIITVTDLINLDKLPKNTTFTLYAVPLNIKDGDGSPVRAFAVVD